MKKDLSPYFEDKFSFERFQNKRWLTSAAAFIAGAALLIVYFQSGPTPETYAAAEDAVAKWEASQDEGSYQDMRIALKKVPALGKKYEAVIAQKLLQEDRLSEALVYAHRSLQRMEGEVPFHASYSATSILIEKGSFQDALEKSVGLKEEMVQICDWSQSSGEHLVGGALLFAHNLLRIACLQQELKNKPGEKAAWEEFESFLKAKEGISHLVFGSFREKGLDLTNYIAERKKQL